MAPRQAAELQEPAEVEETPRRTAEPQDLGGEERRRRLAEAQGRVVAALVAGAEVPEGFDPERMRAQALSLLAKRRAIVARIRPDTAAAAGSDLAAEFAAYAAARTTPPPDYRTDAADFAAWLRERGRLPEEPAPRRRWWSRLPGIR
ncbi:hypothetical protein [Nonomuraea gerenzanensis]|uniref:hypothetical protein n=1 Tax=Nonomuraea gerenzanensis TaxID=93944 RepID=UPI001CDA133B|nr:hypothetical protein [Nonomuraea gerenzanensis]UBU12356.1 hypothetical protein LCN96_50125 [Nonomuraea gerenzanensis]